MNYSNYNQLKSLQEKINKIYVCKSGDTMTGNLNMSCNSILNVKDISFCQNSNISFNCNLINDVSGINFCDGTYIGHGNSFDISTNQLLK